MFEGDFQFQVGGLPSTRVQVHQDIGQVVEYSDLGCFGCDLRLLGRRKQEKVGRTAAADEQQQNHHGRDDDDRPLATRSEEHTSELQSLMRISYAVFCLKKKKTNHTQARTSPHKTHKQNI